ncbi:hypothetical protein GCM10010317_053700 [Streptomyces mirabilis]|nr:hypothetical protein GCM10010317_053700 [Streptomyces mirabilis]
MTTPEAAKATASRLCTIHRHTCIRTEALFWDRDAAWRAAARSEFDEGAGAVSAAGEALGIELEDELVLVALGGVQLPVHR